MAAAVAIASVAQGLPVIKLHGRGRVHASRHTVRPDELTFRHAVNSIGAVLVRQASADRRFYSGLAADGVQHDDREHSAFCIVA